MKTILFIDDEKNILNALKRIFRNLEFECYYAQGIEEAIKIFLAVDNIDMIITDIKMPYFDGIRVLKLFKEASPSTIRVALSGYASSSSVTEAVSKNLAKQYYHKPWNNEDLILSVRKMFVLEDTLKSLDLFIFAQKFEGIKTIPRLFNKINSAIQRDMSIESIANMVSKDPAIASNILRIANSAFYAARTGELQQAIMYIGLNNLKQIVLSYEVAKMKEHFFEKASFIWEHSTRTNRIFQELYELHYKKKIPAIISTAGLMHDIGKIIMFQIYGMRYYEMVLSQSLSGRALLDKELEIFGADHSIIGGYFMNWWAFPVDIIEMTMYHHAPDDERILNRELVALMCVASQIENKNEDESFEFSVDLLGLRRAHIEQMIKKYEVEEV